MILTDRKYDWKTRRPYKMREWGITTIVEACESLKQGIEHTTDETSRHTLDVSLGRVLDAARDNKHYDQSCITPYVTWLMQYRIQKSTEAIRRARSEEYQPLQLELFS